MFAWLHFGAKRFPFTRTLWSIWQTMWMIRSALYSTHLTTSIDRDWDWILDTLWHVIPTKDACDVLMYSPLGDSPFFCFELYYIWEIAFSPAKDEYNEYNCILANIVREVLKYVSDFMGLRDTHLAPNTVGGFGGCWSLHPPKPLRVLIFLGA